MKRFRIALAETTSAFGEPVKWFIVQRRVALFWWVTIATPGQLAACRHYLREGGATDRQYKIIKVIK